MGLIGTLIGDAIGELGDVTRAAIAASLRRTADRVERGEIVSDEEIDKLKGATAKIRDMLKRAKAKSG